MMRFKPKQFATVLCALISAAFLQLRSASGLELLTLSGSSGTTIDFPELSVTDPVGPESEVMLMDVPDWIDVENGTRIGRGKWMFKLSSQQDVRMQLRPGASGHGKITALIYLDSTRVLSEQKFIVKVAQGNTPRQVVANPGQQDDSNSEGNKASIEFPLDPNSPEVLQSENVMLIDVPENMTVSGGVRIGHRLWLIKRENVANASLEVPSSATGQAQFRAFTVGAGGVVNSRKSITIDLGKKVVVAPAHVQPPAKEAPKPASVANAPAAGTSKSQPNPAEENPRAGNVVKPDPPPTQIAKQDTANTTPESAGPVNWRTLLERQKSGRPLTPQAAPAVKQPSNETTKSDDELLVMGGFLVKECTTCHNVYAKDVGIPVMAGLTVERFMDTMDLYRRGRRSNKVMQSIANTLSETETRALALYLARIKTSEGRQNENQTGAAPTPATAPAAAEQQAASANSEESLIGLAKVLVRECTTCHSLYGTDVGIPVMVGIPVDRFTDTIDLYRRKKRSNKIMQSVADSLSEQETYALALYLSRIKPASKDQVASHAKSQEAAAEILGQAENPKTNVSPRTSAVRQRRADDPKLAARIVGWIEKAQDMIDTGSISSARLLLKRAAEYGDARAALLIGSSFDPNVLRWDPTTGIVAEPLEARKWYLEAKALGAGPEVDRRLANLPPVSR